MENITPWNLSALVLAGSLLGLLACGGGTAAKNSTAAPPQARPQNRPGQPPRGDGALSGRLTDQGTSLALADAIVYIQDARKPRVLAKGVTGADGSFTLKDLPLGVPVRVVTQPVAGSLAYAATFSQPVTLAKDTPAPAVNLACAQVAQAGHVELAKAPGQVRAAEIALVQKMDTGDGTPQLIVVRTKMSDGTGACRFDGVPPGKYEVHFLTRGGGRPHHRRRPGQGGRPPRHPGGGRRARPVAEATVVAGGTAHVSWPARPLAADSGPEAVQDAQQPGPDSD
jgi:hypothetical protein